MNDILSEEQIGLFKDQFDMYDAGKESRSDFSKINLICTMLARRADQTFQRSDTLFFYKDQ